MNDKSMLTRLGMDAAMADALLKAANKYTLEALAKPGIDRDAVLNVAKGVDPQIEEKTVSGWIDGAPRVWGMISEEKALLPITGIGEKTAEALVKKGITLSTLPRTPVGIVVKALGDEGMAGEYHEVRQWQIQARELVKSLEVTVRDMREANEQAYSALDDRVYLLRRREKEQEGQLEEVLKQELIAIEVILRHRDPKLVIDSLFKAVQEYQRRDGQPAPDHVDGTFTFDGQNGALKKPIMTLAAMYGIMRRENQARPYPDERIPNALAIACEIVRAEGSAYDSPLYEILRKELKAAGFNTDSCQARRTSRHFGDMLAKAKAEYIRNQPLFEGTFEAIREEDEERAIEAEKWARVTGTLDTMGVSAGDPNLPLLTSQGLAGEIGAGDGLFPSGIAIDLPDLEAQAEVEIIKDNLHAMQAIYFAAMLDEANVFQVRDTLMNNFKLGLLPFGRGRAGDLLYRMIRDVPNRLSEYDRRNLYARTMGFPAGDAHGITNRDFQMLWLRFVSAVSSFARQLSLDNLLRADIPARVRQEQIKKTGRDLAANLSLHGYGISYFAATELQDQVREMIDLLSDSDVKMAYGARDMWGVVEQVSALELGGPRDTVRYRTMASAGAIIIRWLANRADALADAGAGPVLDVGEINRPRERPVGTKPTVNPYDSDLVHACERWLAVTGTPDQQVETYAIPSETPIQTSQPVRIPSIARDMLESVGVDGFGS